MPFREFAKAWGPVFVWMAVIFAASTDLGSTRHTSRIIGPLLRFFKPDVSDETIRQVQVIVRKAGHVSGYAVLAVLCWRALRRLPGWNSREAWRALVISAAYAVTDEIHQSFVPSRLGSAWDVLIDSIGAAAGLWLLWMIGRRRRKW